VFVEHFSNEIPIGNINHDLEVNVWPTLPSLQPKRALTVLDLRP